MTNGDHSALVRRAAASYIMGMADVQQSGSSDRSDQPGKMRTWWHPLLVRMLSFALDSGFKVEQEVSVGKLPLQVDILLIRREGGQLSELAARDLSELLPLLNRFTLIEFKGPTDAMQRGDFAQLAGCSYLWHSQLSEPVSREEVSLIVLVPVVSGALRDELRLLGCETSRHEPGIFRVAGLPFATWLVETDVMAERGRPILSLVSRVFLNDRRRIIETLAGGGQSALAHYHYMVQQVKQFRGEEDFAMQQVLAENLEQFENELVTRMLEEIPIERILERLRGLPPEERLRGLSSQERLRGLPPEEFVAGLTEQEAAQLLQLLQRRQGS